MSVVDEKISDRAFGNPNANSRASPPSIDPAAFLASLREAPADDDADEPVDGEPPPAVVRDYELVVDKATGRLRQAGATGAEGAWIVGLKERCERSLYLFTKVILGRDYLTASLHKPLCDWLQKVPPHRKGALLPREHAKTTIVAQALPLHIHIQPKATNLYFPNEDGANISILLAGENERRVKDAIGVQQSAWLTNATLRAFWPHRIWANVKRDASRWNDVEYVIPRSEHLPDPSLRGIGVGGAITGAHPRVLIKDDLISVGAANSDLVMQEAINWHIASRALVNRPGCLEWIIGTRWAVFDLYSYIQDHDATVEWVTRSIVEDGRPIYPETRSGSTVFGFSETKIAELQKDFGTLFDLLYMNHAKSRDLCDFAEADLRWFTLDGDTIAFDVDGRDAALVARERGPAPKGPVVSARTMGIPLSPATWDLVFGRDEYVRLKGSTPLSRERDGG